MGLSQAQKAIWEKARAPGSGMQGVALTNPICAYLVGTIADDLGHADKFPELPSNLPELFANVSLEDQTISGVEARELYERLLGLNKDCDIYFACLASLHKARLKYERILRTQPIPTIEQVGPRGLLQFGRLTPRSLAALLFWRKWFFDIDNRAGQETGYLFEPIIASAIGGIPLSSGKSPVRRQGDPRKGRQLDCLRGDLAYEFKIRLTIAASGQGRWREELDFPVDCRESGYTPVLVVLDGTPNPKLDELVKVFLREGGQAYVGNDAWQHLDEAAGDTMSVFLDRYVRRPMQSLLDEAPERLPDLTASMASDSITIRVGDDELRIVREAVSSEECEERLPDDVDDGIPGP